MKFKGMDKLLKDISKLDATVQKGVKDIVQDNALSMEGQAKALAPVDSGHLRRNIKTNDKSSDGKVVYEVHAGNVEYAEFVEYGTSKQDAQPFFNPAYKIAEKNLIDDLENLLKKGMK